MRIFFDDMDLGIETVEIKQEVEEHSGNDSVVHIKLEQSYSKECEGIQTEQITDEGEANLAIEAVDIERIKDQPAVVIKSEKLEEEPGINYKEFHTSGFDPDLNIKAEYDLETKSDPAMVRMKAGQNVQSWNEANLTSDEVRQINLEDFPALKVEELELNEELNIKPETIDALSNSVFNSTRSSLPLPSPKNTIEETKVREVGKVNRKRKNEDTEAAIAPHQVVSPPNVNPICIRISEMLAMMPLRQRVDAEIKLLRYAFELAKEHL